MILLPLRSCVFGLLIFSVASTDGNDVDGDDDDDDDDDEVVDRCLRILFSKGAFTFGAEGL